MPEFNIPYGFRPLNPEQLDKRFGPYETLTEAIKQTKGIRVPGLRFGVVGSDGNLLVYEVQANVDEYRLTSSLSIEELELLYSVKNKVDKVPNKDLVLFDKDGKIDVSQLHEVYGGENVKTFESAADFPNQGAEDFIYIALDESALYIWDDGYKPASAQSDIVEISDTEPENIDSVWIDTGDLHIESTQSPVIESIQDNLTDIFERLNTIEFAFKKSMDSGDFDNKAGDDLVGVKSVEPGSEHDFTFNPNATPDPEGDDDDDHKGNPLDVDGVEPDWADFKGNLKHLSIKRGKFADFKPDSLMDGELGYIKDRNLLYIGNDGVPRLINSGGGGGGGGDAGRIGDLLGFKGRGYGYGMEDKDDGGGVWNIYNAEVDDGRDQEIITPGAEQLKGLMISMIYAGGSETSITKENPVSHNFIEIFNTTANDINLKNTSIQVGRNGTQWRVIPLKGIIPSKHAFLIRGARCAPKGLNTTLIELEEYDIDVPDLRIADEGVKVYLTIGTGSSTDANPFNTKGVGGSYRDGYIDLVGIGGSQLGQNVDGYETAFPNILSSNRIIFRIYLDDYNQRPANTRFGDTNNNKADFTYVEVGKNLHINNAIVYKPKTTKDGVRDLFFDKNHWDAQKPNMVTNSFGRNAHTTRTFNWISVGYYDEHLQYRVKGSSDWITLESIKDPTSPYNRVLTEGFDKIWFTTHKQIVSGLSEGTYEYRVGRLNSDYWSDIFEFKMVPYSEEWGFIHTSDQQCWNWKEYEPWRIAIEHIEKWENGGDENFPATGTGKIDWYLNTGDMTENGIRPFEWLYYYNCGKDILPNYAQINVVGNNDLCPNPGELVGKINPDSFEWFYTYEHNPNNMPLLPDGRLMKAVYSFDYCNAHIVVLNSNNYIDQQKVWFEADMQEVDSRDVKPRWKIVLVHDAPFNIITDNAPQRDSPINQVADQDLNKRYSWSRLMEKYGVHLVLSGHKHTYSRSKPLLERLDSEGHVIPLNPIIQTLDSPTQGETQVSEITGITYIMCQATGSKLNSNKDIPAQSIPFNARYFPGGVGQFYPTYIKFDVGADEIEHHSYQITNIMPTESYSYDPYNPITLPKERVKIDTSKIVKK